MSDRYVVVFTGLPGTGKSTLADRLATDAGVPAFAGDWLLGALAPYGVLNSLPRRTLLALYRNLLGTLLTRQLLLGQSAVMDCLIDDETAERWTEQVSRAGARMCLVTCMSTDVQLHRSRVEGRVRGIPGWHEIDWEHVERMRAEQPPLARSHLTLDAVDSIEHNLGVVRAFLGLA
ncbi:MAG: AAA family ATPase [Geodermatophilaceae bacterium]|nr:AAA family ATPase [Geodermatophilaceae bacterium]